MDILQRMIALGICKGGPADILMDSKRQFELISELEIDLGTQKSNEGNCIVVPNNGGHVFTSPVMGYSTDPNMGEISLQVGVFTLLQFWKLIPLVPVFDESRTDQLRIGLYTLPEELFDLEALAKLYKVEQVHADFSNMPIEKKSSLQAFFEEFERKKAVTRKASSMGIDSAARDGSADSSIMLEEVYDEQLLQQITDTLASQKPRTDDDDDIDPWARSIDA